MLECNDLEVLLLQETGVDEAPRHAAILVHAVLL